MSLPCLRLNVEKLCTIQHALILSLHHLSPLWSGFLQVHLSDHPSIRLWCGSDKLSIGQRNSNRLRSEERRVGKEGRCGWSEEDRKEKVRVETWLGRRRQRN